MKVVSCVNFSRIALSYVRQTFNVQLYQEIVTRMTEAWLVTKFTSVWKEFLLFMYLQLYIKTVLSILSIKFCVAEDFPMRPKRNQPRILHGDGQLN